MNKKALQRKRIVQSLRLVWASLDTHLDFSTKEAELMCESCGTRKFHADTVKEYAFIIHAIADLL